MMIGKSNLLALQKKYNELPIQVRASLWFLICSFLQKGISMISTPVFTRLMTPFEYGQYNVFTSWQDIISIFVSLNLSAGVYQQGLVKFNKEKNIFSSSLQGLTFILVIAWTVIYLLAHNFWNSLFSLTTTQMLSMLVIIWSTAAFNFWATEQRNEYKYHKLVGITLLASIAQPALAILFIFHASDKVTARILAVMLVQLISYSGCAFVQLKTGKKIFSAKFWRYALSFNLPLVPHYLSQIVLNNSDRIMIGNMVGADKAGIYSLAYSLSMIMVIFNTAIMNTLNPWIYKKIKDKNIKAIAPVAYLSLGIVASVNLILIILAPEAVKIFAPPSYYEAIYCIPPVAMSVLFIYSYDLFAKFAFYYEKTRLIMLASIGGAVLNIVLNYFGIRIFGYKAAAYTTLICYIFYVVFHYRLMTHICNDYLHGVKPYNTKLLMKLAVIFMICGFALLLTYDYPIIRYAIIILVGTMIITKRDLISANIQKIRALRK